jgi:rSAM/selenodomain-associated transferase 1
VPARVLALFAKAPLRGQVKTRLCPPFTAEEAADLYEAMLLDILDQHAAATGAERVLWYTPQSSFDWFREHVPVGYRLLPQYGPDLAARMAHVFRVHHQEGYGRIVLRGTDSPTLPGEYVGQAFGLLERTALVLGPDPDGGYNLIGLRAPCESLFRVEMGRATVFEQTLEHARAAGLAFELLPPHHDVDTADDLARLAPELSESRTPRTFRQVQAARSRGVIP